jgi:predicted nucleic acid-binding protein
MIAVVDASAAAKWYFEEEYSEDAARLLSDQHSLLAPDLLPTAALSAKLPRGRLVLG